MYCKILVLCLGLFMTFQAEGASLMPAQQLDRESVFEKIYVSPPQIYFSDNRIFIQVIDQGLIEVVSLHTDPYGIYYESAHPQSWTCECGYDNTNTYYCDNCGKAPK